MLLPHFRYRHVTSTNTVALELLRQHPAVFVSTLYQTHGRGRHGRPWFGEYGKNVYCTLGLRQSHSPLTSSAAAYLALGAIAVWDTVMSLTEAAPIFLLKYPNDLLGRCPDGIWRKLSGVLVEHTTVERHRVYLIGIGINVQQRSFPQTLVATATSLALLGFELSPAQVLYRLKQVVELLCDRPPGELVSRWRGLLQLEGRLLHIHGRPGVWRAVMLHEDGRLEVEQDGTRLMITDGDSIRYILA